MGYAPYDTQTGVYNLATGGSVFVAEAPLPAMTGFLQFHVGSVAYPLAGAGGTMELILLIGGAGGWYCQPSPQVIVQGNAAHQAYCSIEFHLPTNYYLYAYMKSSNADDDEVAVTAYFVETTPVNWQMPGAAAGGEGGLPTMDSITALQEDVSALTPAVEEHNTFSVEINQDNT